MDKSQSEEDLKFAEFFDGRYQAKRVILSRSNYKLYEASDTSQHNARVIIQQFTAQTPLSDSQLALHQSTIEILQTLGSQNLFKILNYRLDETQCLLVLECFDSLNLEVYSESGPGRPSLLLVFFQVILALNELHQKSILHVNLRPDNIFVGVGGLVKLGGISLLKSLSFSDSSRSYFNPTPGYSAPEVWESGANLNETADVYSLGSLLYFCVTEGQHPSRIISNSKIPPKFRSIIQKSREVRPEHRYASVRLFEDELLKLLSLDDESHQIENAQDSVSQEDILTEETVEVESIRKERITSEVEASVKSSKNLIKKLGAPLKSIAEDFKEAWQDARQEILQETRDLVKNKLLKSKTTNESNESEMESSESSDDRKTKTIPKKKGIVADAKRIKELRKKEKLQVDLPPKHSSKKVISDTKTTAIEKPAIAFAEEKPEGEKSSKTVSMFWQYIEHINNWSERVKVNLNLSLPVIFGILLIFGIGTTLIFNSNLNEVRKPQISGVFAKEPEVKLLGKIQWRKDELSEWKTLKTQARVEGSQYLYARDGDTELMDQGLDFKLEMRKGCEIHLLHLKGSNRGIKNRIEIGIVRGEFVIHSNSSRLSVEIVDGNARLFGRGVVFKVTGRSGNSNYFVKKGSLSIQLPKKRNLERVSPGRLVRISNGKIIKKSKFDKNLQDF